MILSYLAWDQSSRTCLGSADFVVHWLFFVVVEGNLLRQTVNKIVSLRVCVLTSRSRFRSVCDSHDFFSMCKRVLNSAFIPAMTVLHLIVEIAAPF